MGKRSVIVVLFLCVLVGCTALAEPSPAPPTASATPPAPTAIPTNTATSTPAPKLKITKYPGNFCSFKLETPAGLTIITDPYKMDEDVAADIVTVSHYHADHADFSRIMGDYHLIDAAGEYNEQEVTITAVAGHHNRGDTNTTTTTNIIYVFDFGNIRLAHFGSQGELPSEEMLAQIGQVDILIIQVYGWERGKLSVSEAHRIGQSLEAKIVIPAHGDLSLTDRLISIFGGQSERYPNGELELSEAELNQTQTSRVIVLDVTAE